jgi:hypothetical protein
MVIHSSAGWHSELAQAEPDSEQIRPDLARQVGAHCLPDFQGSCTAAAPPRDLKYRSYSALHSGANSCLFPLCLLAIMTVARRCLNTYPVFPIETDGVELELPEVELG